MDPHPQLPGVLTLLRARAQNKWCAIITGCSLHPTNSLSHGWSVHTCATPPILKARRLEKVRVGGAPSLKARRLRIIYPAVVEFAHAGALKVASSKTGDAVRDRPVVLRRGTKASKCWGKMGIEWDSRDGPNGHQRRARRCDLCL
jgi:hypothetical protein